MECLISIGAKIAEYTVAPIGRQVAYFLFYQSNFNVLNYQIEDLEKLKERNEHDVDEGKRNGGEIEEDVISWQKRAIETLEEAKRLREDPSRSNVGCSKWSFPNLKSRYELSRNAKKMADTIVELQGKGKFSRVWYARPLRITSFISSTRGSVKLESRNSRKEKIMLSLRNPKISNIGVYGLSGIGKTTLVKDVANQVGEDKLFETVVIANITEPIDIERIQKDIADQLGLGFKEMTIDGRARRLSKRVREEKSILIILDNLPKKIELEKLGIPYANIWGKINLEKKEVPSKDDYKGCKLLLTSRSLAILEQHNIQEKFMLDFLDDVESQSLFEALVGDVEDADVKNIATQVVQRCKGLPALIVTIAQVLKDKNIYHWKDLLNRMKSDETLFPTFEYNYNQLEKEAKEIFLLYGVRGTFMWFSDLLKYVIGLGIFKDIGNIENARIRLYKIIDDLKAHCLLLDDGASARETKMLDTVCQMATSIAYRDKYVFTMKGNSTLNWPNKDFLGRCTQISLVCCCIQNLPENLDCPDLKFFHLDSTDNRTLGVPPLFFVGMRNLEVLDLTGMNLSLLPTSLTSLTKLKTLCLDQCILEDVHGIGSLKSLEVLSFISSSMKEFPNEIAQLTHLRMLDLSYAEIESTSFNIVSNLIKLEELYMGNASIKWEIESSTRPNQNAGRVELGQLTSLTTLEIQIREAWMLSRDMMFEKLDNFKVIIGDKWQWWDDNGTSRVLKLQLHTSIHLEHGIKTLIKSVEDLYLDEVNGISNVLFHLNGDGFPQLKHLYIQSNSKIQHIINSMERNQTCVLFPKLETLKLQNLCNLVKICHGPLTANSFGKLTVIKVQLCEQLVYLFSVSMAKTLSKLVEIEVSECCSMKMIVFVENVGGGINTDDDKIEFYSLRSLTLQHLPAMDDLCSNELIPSMTTEQRNDIPLPFFNNKVKFSNLDSLKLTSINVKKIWDDNDFSAPYSILNLTCLTVEDCSGLKYLFPSSMIGSLSKLKQLEISRCDMMEEIIATQGRHSAALEEVLLPKLETIIINDMQSLKRIWNPILSTNSMGNFNTLEIKKCEKIENIFPAYMHGAFATLETLLVEDCNSVQEIFQVGVNYMRCAKDTTQLMNITLLRLPHLKQIWTKDPQFRLQNLQVVRVEDCEDLEYLFPSSIAMYLFQLEKVTLIGDRKLKEIVSDKEGAVESPVKFEFNNLSSLTFWSLDELEGFFARNHGLVCPSLRNIDVRSCMKLKPFKTHGTSSPGRDLDSKLKVSKQQSLFTLEEVAWNLESMALDKESANMILEGKFSGEQFSKIKSISLSNFEDEQATFPYWCLQSVSNLERLLVEWSSFEEIFQEGKPVDDNGQIEITTRIKELDLYHLHELQYICKEGFQIDPILQVLDCLYVDECSNLKHLVPSTVTFSYLTYLDVQSCKGMIHLIAPSTARSLLKLTTLKIRECNSMEQIVVEEGGESENEIAFNSLEVLELESLPKLNMFCSSNCLLKLPLLVRLTIIRCPRMKCFSKGNTTTPLLQGIWTDDQDEKQCWEGDLDRTVNKMFQDMEAFSSFNHLELSEYPELKERWYSQVEPTMFSNLKLLVVHQCAFLSHTIFSSNLLQLLLTLEELQVTKCDSLGAVFDVQVVDDKGMHPKASGLKKLTLSDLPNLKHIWNEDPPETLSFKNLLVVKVAKCQNLKNLFCASLCNDLKQLEEIEIVSCGVEEIVANEEGLEERKFDFPRLRVITLIHLTRLNDFYPKRYNLECPSLKILNVDQCESLQVFAFGPLDSQQLRGDCVDLPIQQALFQIEKVPQNLEDLSLNERDAMRILNGNYEKNLFQSIQILRLQYFQETPMKFPNDFVQRFPAMTTFQARLCSFGTLFPSEEIGHCIVGNPAQIKKLCLFQLEQLEYIWEDNPGSDALVSNLEDLFIGECSRLIRFAPPSTSFINLTMLKVNDCNGLKYFLTTFTAKSLVGLTNLTISNCGMLEEVVMMDEGESEGEIIFASLKLLELNCLSGLKSFCSGKQAFIFPSLVALKVVGCHKMQNFSSGVIVAPFLKLMEVENGKKRWKEDLNTTIKQLLIDKAIREGNEGSCIEPSNYTSTSSQDHERTLRATQNGSSSSTIQDAGESQASEAHSCENLVKQATTVDNEESDAVIGTQEMHETIEMPLVQPPQDTLGLPTIREAAMDPSPSSQAPQPGTSSSALALNAYGNYKGMIDISEQIMPYLVAGLNRHPQVLNWLNTGRRRVFSSSFFSLFAEVTCILRTTRKVDLTEDDRNYIRECCAALQGVGFDDSWIGYVHGCIEECGDGEDLKRKVEEAEGQASNLRAQLESIKEELASVEESLLLLRDKASRLHDFIES